MFFLADVFVESVQYGSRTELCKALAESRSPCPWKELKGVVAQAKLKGISPSDYDVAALRNTTIDFSKAGRQWTYQYCSEVGFYQTPSNAHRMRSMSLNVSYWSDMCKRAFGPGIHDHATPFDYTHGAQYLRGSNIFFTNGVEDPWQWAGVRKVPAFMNVDQPGHGMIAHVVDCPDCGHCVELYTEKTGDASDLVNTRSRIRSEFYKWLA